MSIILWTWTLSTLGLLSWLWKFLPDDAAQLQNKRLNVLRKTFHQIDIDDNQTINKDELHHYWMTAGAQSSVRHRFVEKLWTKLDKDDNSEITIEEFMTAAGVGKDTDIAVRMSVKPLQTLLMAHPKLLLKVSEYI
jgi:hypothetical protein